MRIFTFLSLALIFTLSPITGGAAQNPAAPAADKASADLHGLTTYPLDIRKAILELCIHPKVLAGISKIQSQSALAFKKLLSSYPKAFQKQFYELARFPKLVNELTAGGKKTEAQVKKWIKPYPGRIHKFAIQAATKNFDLLNQIQSLNNQADKEFAALIKDAPERVRSAVLKVLQHPEILIVLNKYPKLAKEVAQAHAKNPELGMKEAHQVLNKVQKGNAKALKNWPDKNEQHQRALAALEKSEASFDKEYDKGFDQVLDPAKAVQWNVNYNPIYYPYLGSYGMGLYEYPYWFGFPGWGFDGYDWY